MSLDIHRPTVPGFNQEGPLKEQVQRDTSSCALREPSSSISAMARNHVDEIHSAAADEDDIYPASPQQQRQEKQPRDALPVDESAEARLERLGRQRPEVFNSIWSEIGFVFSISMCQVLSVRSSQIIILAVLTGVGIFCVWIHCHTTHFDQRSRHSSCIIDMASKCILLDCCVVSLDLWPTCRHVWGLSYLCCRYDMAYDLGFDRWVLHQRNYAQLLSSPSRTWSSRFPPFQCYDPGEHLSTWSKKEPCVQYLWSMRTSW